MPEIQIVGAGPAGSAAAIRALSESAAVHILERSRSSHHKVCGEFIPPEACRVLDELGVWQDFVRLNPARIRRTVLHFGSRTKQWNLREPAFSLSRLELDRLLLERAVTLGARLSRGESFHGAPATGETLILAHGRQARALKSGRLFGFKAHFEGPTDDAVELHFTKFGYLGISAVENDRTNVCGIAPEEVLRRFDFEIDEVLRAEPALAERLRPMSRRMPWLTTGPLIFSRVNGNESREERIYPAGDALGFVDPFTGSGILNALLTGRLAGRAAARQIPVEMYVEQCAALLNRPFAVSTLFRILLRTGLSKLALLVPGEWLYSLTRAHVPGVG